MFEDGGVLRDARVIPGVETLGPDDTELAERAVGPLHETPDVAASAEFAYQAAAGLERARHGGGRGFGRLDPMQHGIREDGVEFVLVRQRADIPSLELKQREVFAGLGDHGFGTIDAEHTGAGLSDSGGEMAGAAAGVQDAFADRKSTRLNSSHLGIS